MAREMERQVKDAMDHCLEKLASRCAVVDAGKDHAAFPREARNASISRCEVNDTASTYAPATRATASNKAD